MDENLINHFTKVEPLSPEEFEAIDETMRQPFNKRYVKWIYSNDYNVLQDSEVYE